MRSRWKKRIQELLLFEGLNLLLLEGFDLVNSAGCTDEASAVVVNIGWASQVVVDESGCADEDGGTFFEE